MSVARLFRRIPSYDERVQKIAAQITSDAHLERLLLKVPRRERAAMRQALVKHLPFEPKVLRIDG